MVPSGGQVVVVSKVKKGGSEMKQDAIDSTAGGNVGRLSEAPRPCLMKRWRRQRQVGRSRRWQRRWQKPEGEGNGLSGLSGAAGQAETGGVTRTKEGKWLRRKGQEAKGGIPAAAAPLKLLQVDIGLLDVPFRGKTLRVKDGAPCHSTRKWQLGRERSHDGWQDGRLAIRKSDGPAAVSFMQTQLGLPDLMAVCRRPQIKIQKVGGQSHSARSELQLLSSSGREALNAVCPVPTRRPSPSPLSGQSGPVAPARTN